MCSLLWVTESFTPCNRQQLSLSLRHCPAALVSADAAVFTDVRLIPNAAFFFLCAVVASVTSIFESICLCSTAPPDGPLALAEARRAPACSVGLSVCRRVFKVVLLFVGESPSSCHNSSYQEVPTRVTSRRSTTQHNTKKGNKTIQYK